MSGIDMCYFIVQNQSFFVFSYIFLSLFHIFCYNINSNNRQGEYDYANCNLR